MTRGNNDENEKSTGIFLDGSTDVHISGNLIKGFEQGIHAKNSTQLNIGQNTIDANNFNEGALQVMATEIEEVKEAIEKLAMQKKNSKNIEDILLKLSPAATQIFLFLLKQQGIME